MAKYKWTFNSNLHFNKHVTDQQTNLNLGKQQCQHFHVKYTYIYSVTSIQHL